MKLMTTKEAAAHLGVGTTTIKRWSDEGVLSCVRTAGGHRRYRQADVLALQQDEANENSLTLAERLPTMSEEQLDSLPHGVIELDDAGLVLQYNATESEFSGVSKVEAVGRHFFASVAPCTNNSLVHGRFREGVRTGTLDVRLFYTFSYRLELINVILRLYRDPGSQTNWVIIDTGRQIARRIR